MSHNLTLAQLAEADQVKAAAVTEVDGLLRAIADHRAYCPNCPAGRCNGIGQEAAAGLISMQTRLRTPALIVALSRLADQQQTAQVPA